MTRKLAVLALAGGIVACERTIPTAPTPDLPTAASQIFTGTIAPGDAPLTRLNIPGGATLRVYLGALNDPGSGLPNGGSVTLRFGVPASDTVCNALQTVAATARLTALVTATVSAGEYCIQLDDTAGLPGPTYYSLRLILGNPTFPDLVPGTIPYSSSVIPGGTTSRSFEASVDGLVRLTMEQITGTTTLGMGVGYTRVDGSGCDLSSFVMATAGTVFSVNVDSANYCVKVFDPGTLTAPANFTVRITHP
jgi:hypothetical protein